MGDPGGGRDAASWDRLLEAYDNDEVIHGKATEVVEGGLLVDVGVPAFLPAALAHVRPAHDPSHTVGNWIDCRILDLNLDRRRIILDRRSVMVEDRWEERRRVLESLEEGEVVEGKVSVLADFGAFVDLEGIDGLVHISELSWDELERPGQAVRLGEKVRVVVLEVDLEREKVALSLKRVLKEDTG